MGLKISQYLMQTEKVGVDVIVLRLPEILSVQIFSQWIRMGDLTRVDSAFCNRKDRNYLLKLLTHKFLSLRREHIEVNLLKFRWVLLRGIKVGSVKISSIGCCPDGPLIFPIMSAVRRLHLLNCVNIPHINLSQLISSCELLTELWLENVENFNDDTVLNINPSSISKLWLFCARQSLPHITSVSVNYLSNYCCDLKYLDLKMSGLNDLDIEVSLITLFKANRKLELVHLLFTHHCIAENILTSISQYCPLINDVCLGNCEQMSLSLIQQFLLSHEKTLYIMEVQFGSDICSRIKYSANCADNISEKWLDIRNVPNLHSLERFFEVIVDFVTISIGLIDFVISAEVINAIVNHSPNVREVRFLICGPVSCDPLKLLFEKCTKLATLELSAQHSYSNADFKSLFMTPNNVTYLNISYHDTLQLGTVLYILANNSKITTIRCKHCSKFSEDALGNYLVRAGFSHVKLCTLNYIKDIEVLNPPSSVE